MQKKKNWKAFPQIQMIMKKISPLFFQCWYDIRETPFQETYNELIFLTYCICLDEPVRAMSCTWNNGVQSLRKGGDSDTCCSMSEPWGRHAKHSQPVTKRQMLCDPTYMRYLDWVVQVIKQSTVVVSRGLGRGEWELMFSGDRVSVSQDERSYGSGWWKVTQPRV